jgi:hypothetical protein
MDQFAQQLEQHWTILVAIASGVFFLYKIREEETLRTRLKLIYECYTSLALINDAIQDWAHPLITTTVEEHDAILMKRIQDEMPNAQKYFHQAAVLMRPETVRSIRKIFIQFGLLRAEYTNWEMFKSQGAGFAKQTVKAFDNAKKHIPKNIEDTLHDILTDFQVLVNGSPKMLWWKISGCCYPRYRCAMNNELLKSFDEDRKALIAAIK